MTNKIRGRNEGSIYQRSNGKWRAQISVKGKRQGKTFNTKKEAQTWLRNMQSKLDKGYDIQGGKISLGKYLGEWLEGYRIAIRPKTYNRYKGLVEKYMIPYIGHIPLNELNSLTVEKFYSDLILDGVGTRNIRHIHSVLHRALVKAASYGFLMRNPAHGVTLPKYNPPEMQVWDASQVSVFLVAADDSRHRALYYLAITTGMRQGEIFGLKWADVDWDKGTIQVQRQVQYVPGQGRVFQDPKTRAGRRKISLPDGTLEALKQHNVKQKTLIAFAGKRWKDNNLIFPNTVGNPLDPSNLRLDFNRIISKTNLPKIRFHDLRHTAASLMLNNDVPLIVVSRILGHSKPSTTLDIYGHLYNEMQGEAAKIMDALVTPLRVDLSRVQERVSR